MTKWTPERWLLMALGLLTLIRLTISAISELTPDETYYYLWAERLDWSYYSKGPGIALAIKFSTALFGQSSFGLRTLSPLLGFFTSWLLFRLGRRLVGEPAAIWAVAILNLTPIFNAGGILLTIDPLMMFFWVAAMVTVEKAARLSSPRWWIGTGFLIGLGFLAKYTILLEVVAITIFLAVSQETRKEFRRPGFYLMLGAILLCTTPVLIWNAQNGWITITHLGDHTKSGPSGPMINPMKFLEYVGYHLGVYSPLLFVGLAWTMVLAFKRFRRSREELFLASFSLPLLTMYFLLSFKAGGEPNWTAPGFLCLGLLLPKYWAEAGFSRKLKRGLATAAVVLAGVLTAFAVNPEPLRALGITWDYERDPRHRWSGWESSSEQLATHVTKFYAETDQKPFLIANRYQVAAALAFYFPDETTANLVLRPTKAHPLIHAIEPHPGFKVSKKGDGGVVTMARVGVDRAIQKAYEAAGDSKLSFGVRTSDGTKMGVIENHMVAPIDGSNAEVQTIQLSGVEGAAVGDSQAGHSDIKNQFSFWPAYSKNRIREAPEFLGENALFVTDNQKSEGPPQSVRDAFGRYEVYGWVNLVRRGEVLRSWKVFACYDYKGLQLPVESAD